MSLAQAAPTNDDSLAVRTRYDSLRILPLRVEAPAVASTRGHHARVGAIAGALVGAAAGVIGSTYMGVACIRNPCHETRTRIGLAIWFGSLGAIGGSIVGGVLGALAPSDVYTGK